MEKFEDLFKRNFVYLDAFMRNVENNPDRPALTCTTREERWTYEELNRECNRLANRLREKGVERNDVVMASLFNTAEYVFFWIATQKAGAIFSPINFRLPEGEIAMHIDDSQPRIYVYDCDLAETAGKAVQMSKSKPELSIMAGEGTPFPQSISYHELVQGGATDDCYPSDPAEMDEIVRLYTSGTTGEPKGVPLNNINNLLRSYDVLMHFPLGPRDKTLNMTPWFHAGGLHSGGPCPTLHAGGEIVALKAFSPRQVLDLVEKYGLTFLIGAPPNMEMLAVTQEKHPRNVDSLKGLVSMGAPLNKDACLKYHRVLTPNIFNGYGTTETFWNTFLRPYELPDKAGTSGRACTDDRVRVVKIYESGEKAEPEEIVARDNSEEGEVVIQTLKAPHRYHNKPEYDKSYYRGWYYTKDVATWDEEGFITICGRRDEMVISRGENIHPPQVEAIINEHPKVDESIVVGVPDKVRGKALAAYVRKEDESLTGHELYEFLNEHPNLAKFKRPRFLRFTEELPFTPTGKKQHYLVEDRAHKELEEESDLLFWPEE